MNQIWRISGFIYGALAVGIGAFGAHSLQPLLGEERFKSFDTGVKYLMFHAILMAALGVGAKTELPKIAWRLFFFGVICFSGSIFLLSTRELTGWHGLGMLWPITPIGGLLLLSGWLYMARFYSQKNP
jgi:uncharacterized membrane protein YgdD (TMEM256/DUF423 family)